MLDPKLLLTFFENSKKLDALKKLIMVYFDSDGLELQFNVINSKELLEVPKHPERYVYLIVRVSGYSTYFYIV